MQDRVSRSTGRHRREEMSPQRERAAWQRAEERMRWGRYLRGRGKALGELERRTKREWSALYGRQERQRELQAESSKGAWGRFRQWRELGGGLREMAGALRGRTEVLGRFRAELEVRHRWERIVLGKAHSEVVRGIERKEGEAYRSGMEGSKKRAWEAARTDGRSVYYDPAIDWYTLNRRVWEERMEQVRELDGEQAYEELRRAVERARQPLEPRLHVPSREGPQRSGPERDYGPSR